MKYRARRRVTSFEVIVETDDGRQNGIIADITEKGARLRLSLDLEEGTEVTIPLHGKDRTARVVWRKEGEAGVAFDQILPLDVLTAVDRSMHRPNVMKKKRFLMG